MPLSLSVALRFPCSSVVSSSLRRPPFCTAVRVPRVVGSIMGLRQRECAPVAMPDYAGWTDEDLVVSGGREALEVLIRRYKTLVKGIVASFVKNPADRPDVAQDVWLLVFRFAASFNPAEGDFKPWLATIARNACLSYLRRRHPILWDDLPLRGPVLADDLPERPFDPEADDGLSPEFLSGLDPGDPPDVHACKRRLAPELREALVLRYEEELSIVEVAALQGISPAAASNRCRKALRTVQWCMKQKGHPLTRENVTFAIADFRFALDLIEREKGASYDLVAWCMEGALFNQQLRTKLESISGARLITLNLNRKTAEGVVYGDECLNKEKCSDYIAELRKKVVLSLA